MEVKDICGLCINCCGECRLLSTQDAIFRIKAKARAISLKLLQVAEVVSEKVRHDNFLSIIKGKDVLRNRYAH